MEVLILSEKANPQITPQHLKKLRDYAQYFYGSFNKIHVLSSFDTSQLNQIAFPSNTIIHKMPPWRSPGSYIRIYYHLKYLLKLLINGYRLVKEYPDIKVISNNYGHYALGLIVVMLSIFTRRKSIIRVAGDPEIGRISLQQRYGMLGRLIGSQLSHIESFVAKRADRIFSSSQLFADQYPQFAYKTEILPNPVKVLDESCRRRIGGKLKNRNDGEYVQAIFVGRLEPEKGLNILLEALTEIPTVYCTIVGSGSLRAYLEGLTEELELSPRIIICGQMQHDEVLEMMARSDVLILPSFTEYTPNVILEAAALEIPVIASRVGGVKYMVQDNRTGLLFNPGDVQSLRNALRLFQDSPDLWSKWGANARIYACDKFGSQALLRKSEAALQSLKREIND